MTDDPPSKREQYRRTAKARREAKAALRRLSFEAVAQGWGVDQIAEIRKVSARTVRREIDAELARRRLDVPARYVHFQVARLTKALRLADAALDEGHLAAIAPMVRVVAALDRYHGLGPVRAAGPSAVSLPSATAPLALPQSAPPLEIAAAEHHAVTNFGA
jgi:AraC-like DNA-binding protein